MTLPAFELLSGTVTGQFIVIMQDGLDDDLFPDIQPLNGTVYLRATVTAGRVQGAIAEIAVVPLEIFGGQIVDEEGNLGVRILSTDEDLGVEDWAWRATFEIEGGLRLKPITFKLPSEGTVSLTDRLVPVESAPYQIVEGRPGESAYEIMVRRGDFTGTEEEWVDYYFNREGGGGGEGETSWSDVTGKPTAFPPTAHEHTTEQVTGLGAALDGKQDKGDYATKAFVAEAVDGVPPPDLSGLVASPTVASIWTGTAAEYDAISPKVETTLYIIIP